MNIIYVIEDYSENGGVERIVSDKANTLSTQYHHNVTLISVYRDNRKEQFKLNDGVNLIANKQTNYSQQQFNRQYQDKWLFIAFFILRRPYPILHDQIDQHRYHG